jgi:hypothetical protein
MKHSSIKRMATTALVTGFASMALVAPASALEAPDPDAGNIVSPAPSTTSTDDGNWMEISLGALGGLVIAGAGIAAVAGIRHRNAVPTG